MTLRRKLLLWYTGVLAVSGFALMLAVYLLTEHQMRRELDRFLYDEVREWTSLCREHGQSVASLEEALRSDIGGERYFPLVCRLYDPAARRNVLVIAPDRWRKDLALEIGEDLMKGGRAYSTLALGGRGEELRLLAVRLTSGPAAGLVLQGGIQVHRLNERLRALRLYFGGAFAAAVLISLAGGTFLASRSLRPVDEIASGLELIESENLSFRLEAPRTRDEVERLRKAINRMLDRLQESFRKVGGFTADAAHELRTPLASLQCRLEVALNRARMPDEYRQALADALAETAGLARMVNNLMFLATMDAQALRPKFEAVSLRSLLLDMHDVFGVAAEEKGLQFATRCESDCTVSGDAALLRRLFGNLVDNAVRYTPRGGKVGVTCRVENEDCVVSVEDTGIGISPEARQRIFNRFYRADESRSRNAGGAGLGLNICRGITELHRGAIYVQSEEGKGSVFEVRLPRAPPERTD